MMDNILKWIQVRFNAHLWCVVKHMLQEEGFFLFASGMTHSISGQEWRQHVEVAFETLKGHMELWWD
jgi:hypothetical protein